MDTQLRLARLGLAATTIAAGAWAQATLEWRSWELGTSGASGCGITALAVDPAGAVYVVEAGACDPDGRANLTRREGDGQIAWTRRLPRMTVGGLELAPDGDIVVFGTASRAPQPLLVLRWSPMGEARWSHVDIAPHLASAAFDGQGTLYLAGSLQGDLWIRALGPDGHVAWERSLDGPSHASDKALDIAVDPSDDLLVVGAVGTSNGETDGAAIKLSSDGTVSWFKTFGYADADESYVRVASDGLGGAVVGGSVAFVDQGWPPVAHVIACVMLYDASGASQGGYMADWNVDSSVRDLLVDPFGQSWIAILADQPPQHVGCRLLVVRQSADGHALSEYVHTPPAGESWPGNLLLDADGSVLASGARGSFFGSTSDATLLMRFDAQGEPLWIQEFTAPTKGLRTTRSAFAPNGRVVLAGNAGEQTTNDTAVVLQVALHDGPWTDR